MTTQNAPAHHQDNLLGVCHTLGDTFGFNPIFPRVALLIGVMLNAEYAILAYAVGGVAVLAAKLATRSRAKQPTRALIEA